MLRPVFEDVVARQAGVVSLDQAVAHGYSADRVQRRVRERQWQRLQPRVFLVGGHRLTDEARIRAAALWAGPDATVTGPSAAYWHGMLPRPPNRIELMVPAARKPRPPPGLHVRRRDLADQDVAQIRGVRVAAAGLAALQTAIALPAGSAFLDRALQRHVPFDELYRAYCRAMGRPGSADMARLLVAAADRADSAAERILIRLLRTAGITGWTPGHPEGPYLIDVAFPDAKVAIEVDGWAWHVDHDRFVNDRHKNNALVRAGWVVLRFTWHDLTRSPHSVVAQISAALAAAA